MARPKKNSTYEEQIARLNQAIETMEKELALLKAKRDDAIKAKEQRDMEELFEIIKSSGKSIEEVKDMISR